MKYGWFFLLLLHSSLLNAQSDSVPPKRFETFFGDECAGDTLTFPLFGRKQHYYQLIKSAKTLRVYTPTKTKWILHLNEELIACNQDDWCIRQFGEKYLVVLAVTEDQQHSNNCRVWIHQRNGRVRTVQGGE